MREQEMENCGNGDQSQSHAANSRWNPTQEQIRMLERLYEEGIRTPSAEEIQQITARLRVYGHIEGKNVFYWFQNHKARQRQKQKQETIAFYNRYLHAPPPPPHQFFPLSPLPTNGVGAAYCMGQAQSEMGFYPQHPNAVVPGGYMRSTAEKDPVVYEGKQHHRIFGCNLTYNTHETLNLFPLHPTGIVERRTATEQLSSSSMASANSADTSADTASASAASPDINQDCASPPNPPFFDFFPSSGQGS